MDVLIFVIRKTVSILLDVLEIGLFARAILSWVDPMGNWKISDILFAITEPFLYPIRLLCEKMHWFENLPIDIPFLIGWLLLSLLRALLAL